MLSAWSVRISPVRGRASVASEESKSAEGYEEYSEAGDEFSHDEWALILHRSQRDTGS